MGSQHTTTRYNQLVISLQELARKKIEIEDNLNIDKSDRPYIHSGSSLDSKEMGELIGRRTLRSWFAPLN